MQIALTILQLVVGVLVTVTAPGRTIEIAAFGLVLALAMAQGFLATKGTLIAWRRRWTKEGEILAWEQPQIGIAKEDIFGTILRFDQTLRGFIYLIVPIVFVAIQPEPQTFVLLILAVMLPGHSLGIFLGHALLSPGSRRAVTVLEDGVVNLGQFFAWERISWFEQDRRDGSLRLYARTPAQTLMVVLQPPDQATLAEALAVVRRHLPSQPPAEPPAWYICRPAWAALLLGLVVSRFLWAIAPISLFNRDIACLLLWGGFSVSQLLILRVVHHILGQEIRPLGAGLQQAGA